MTYLSNEYVQESRVTQQYAIEKLKSRVYRVIVLPQTNRGRFQSGYADTYQIAFRGSLEGVLDRIRRSHNIDNDDRQNNGDGGTSEGA